MPIRRSHAKRVDPKDIRKVTVEYDGETMPVEYNIRALTPATLDMLSQPARALPGLAHLLADILVKWGVLNEDEDGNLIMDEDGNPVVAPISYAALSEFPTAFLDAVSTAVMDDVKVPKANESSFKTG